MVWSPLVFVPGTLNAHRYIHNVMEHGIVVNTIHANGKYFPTR
jgi:hypothetical protein